MTFALSVYARVHIRAVRACNHLPILETASNPVRVVSCVNGSLWTPTQNLGQCVSPR